MVSLLVLACMAYPWSCGLIPLFFWLFLMFPLACVELLVLGTLVGQALQISITIWVKLLFLEPWLEKHFRALGRLSY